MEKGHLLMARGAASPIGAERISQNGYHYTKTEGGWTLTSRLIAERDILLRPLLPGERVLFRNGNRLDLRPENLIVNQRSQAGMSFLQKRRTDLLARIEELQGQLADLDEKIKAQESNAESVSNTGL